MSTAVILGVGPLEGLGARLCQRFAAAGLHVVIGGRTSAHLDAVMAAIRTDGGTATAAVTDATRETDVRRLFEQAGDDLELAIYNRGTIRRAGIVDGFEFPHRQPRKAWSFEIDVRTSVEKW